MYVISKARAFINQLDRYRGKAAKVFAGPLLNKQAFTSNVSNEPSGL